MLLLECQGKALLRHYGVAAPEGYVISTKAQFDAATTALAFPIVLKAQIATGSRGKNGGIAFAEDPETADRAFRDMLGKEIRGFVVDELLVETRLKILAERYVAAFVYDGDIHIMASSDGGIEIEQIARERPNQIILSRVPGGLIDRSYLASALNRIGFPVERLEEYVDVLGALCQILIKYDATLAEINPLVETEDKGLVALDARIDIDNGALRRQAALFEMLGVLSAGDSGHEVGTPKITPIASGGRVGLIGLGGGLNLSIVDWLHEVGEPVAVLTDVDDAIASGQLATFLRTCIAVMKDGYGVNKLLFNVISASYPLDDVARAINMALNALDPQNLTLAFNLQGRRSAEAGRILAEARRVNARSLDEAIQTIIKGIVD